MPSDDPSEAQVNFDAPAGLRKWPSLKNERLTDGSGPYLIVASTLGECIRELMARPAAARHLYEIQTAAQPPLVSAVSVRGNCPRTSSAARFSLG